MASDPLIGTTVGGCEILEIIGQGGMGIIYKSRQKSLDRIVALKVLARHLATDINFVSRFNKEARAIAKVNHPNILAVYDVGDDNNVNYMIMELIEGKSLAELQTDRHGAIPWEEATEYIRQSAQGLEAAQAVGIIHRDIKPENLMITAKKSQIKVSDFGLAKEADSGSGNTSVDAVMGTPAFMSPEQCDGKKVDGRSDIYSLGGTFYRLVSGRLPFEAETAMSMMYRHKHEALIPPHEIVPTVPQSISAVIVKMMAKKREQRYQTMTDVIDAIDTASKSASAPQILVQAPARNLIPVPMHEYTPHPDPAPAGFTPSFNAPADHQEHYDMNSAGTAMGRSNQSGRMTAQPASGFGSGADSSAALSMPTSVMGVTGGMNAPDEGYTNVSRGDELMGRGDRVAALKYYRHALKSAGLDQATRARVDGELRKEISARRTSAESLLKRGLLVEASRECRQLVEMDPADEFAKQMLKDLDIKLALKRTMVNDIRTAIAASQFEKAIKTWESTPPELRDDSLGKQLDQLRNVVVPAIKLAEQGESLSEQGRLEEAISSFEDAIKINPACEPARMGLKEAEQKVQRIDYMLKEGYQASLEQNYSKAVETLKPILRLRPGHPQAVKSIVDACAAHAQNLREHGDLEGALEAYRDAADTDSQNRTIRRSLDELTNLRDKEQALIDRAQDAAARQRLGESVGYWKEVQRVNPQSKKAAQQIDQLSRQRSSGLLKALLVLMLVAGAVGTGYQYYYERKELSRARDLMKQKRFSDAMQKLASANIMFLNAEKDQLAGDADIEVEAEIARKLEMQEQWLEAAAAFEKLAEGRLSTDRKRQQEMMTQGVMARAQHAVAQGKLALLGRKWDQAANSFNEVKHLAEKQKHPLAALTSLADFSERATILANRVSYGEKAADMRKKVDEFRFAKKLADEMNLPALRDYIESQLKTFNIDDTLFEKLKKEGIAALSQSPPDLPASRKAFTEATQAGAQDASVAAYLLYIADIEVCNKDGMVLSAASTPLKTQMWDNDERRTAFCVDRFEYPNEKGVLPKTGMTWLDARNLCKEKGKELCSARQWTSACKGENRVNVYPYGENPDPGACNTGGKSATASGLKTKCQSSIGAFDMSGNVAEWVAGDETATDSWIMGGSFKMAVGQTTCDDRAMRKQTPGTDDVGFRCCRALDKH